MRLLSQIIFDVTKNKFIYIFIEPSNKYIVSVNDDDISDEKYGGMTKEYPTGAFEEITYNTENIIDIELNDKEPILYLSYDKKCPTRTVYSLLNKKVKFKKFEINKDDILLGEIPNIATILYSNTTEDTVGRNLGLVYKDKYYNDKYDKIKSILNSGLISNIYTDDDKTIYEQYSNITKSCCVLDSASTNKQKEDLTYYVKGNVIANYKPYYGGSTDSYIEGVEYNLGTYEVDYYNRIVIPYRVTSEVNSKHTGPVQNLISEGNIDGGFTYKSFSTKIRSVTDFEYIYAGEEPLKTTETSNTTMYGLNYVNLNDFMIVIYLDAKAGNLKNVFVANRYSDDEYYVNYTERTHTNYEKQIIQDTKFYKPTSIVKSRQEDCIIAEVNGKKLIYECTKGASTQSSLMNYLAMIDRSKFETIINTTNQVYDVTTETTLKRYYVNNNGSDIPLFELVATGGGAFYAISNSNAKVYTSRERFERSILKMSELGKLNSYHSLHSERVGDLTQDYDSKQYIGGSLPLKTFTVPTYEYETSSGGGKVKTTDKFSNIGYGNAAYYTEDDVKVIADNFNLINDHLASMTINFKGLAKIEDLEIFFGKREFILDKVSQDIGKNISSFSCRTVIFN